MNGAHLASPIRGEIGYAHRPQLGSQIHCPIVNQIRGPLGKEGVCPSFALTVNKFVFVHSGNFRAKANPPKPRSCLNPHSGNEWGKIPVLTGTCLQRANGIKYFFHTWNISRYFLTNEIFKNDCHIWNISFEIFQCNITNWNVGYWWLDVDTRPVSLLSPVANIRLRPSSDREIWPARLIGPIGFQELWARTSACLKVRYRPNYLEFFPLGGNLSCRARHCSRGLDIRPSRNILRGTPNPTTAIQISLNLWVPRGGTHPYGFFNVILFTSGIKFWRFR